MSEYYDVKNFNAILKGYSRRMEALAVRKLFEAGYYGVMPVPGGFNSLLSLSTQVEFNPFPHLYPSCKAQEAHSIYASDAVESLVTAYTYLIHAQLVAPFNTPGKLQVSQHVGSESSLSMLDVQIFTYSTVTAHEYKERNGFAPFNQREFVRFCMNHDANQARTLVF